MTVGYRQILTDIQAGRNEAAAQGQPARGQTVGGQVQRVKAGRQQISLRDQNGKGSASRPIGPTSGAGWPMLAAPQ